MPIDHDRPERARGIGNHRGVKLTRTSLLFTAAAIVAACAADSAVRARRSSATTTSTCPTAQEVYACPVSECGSNTQILSRAKVYELNLDGEWSHGARFVPGSLQTTCAPGALTLDRWGSELVVRDAGGAVVCQGSALVGASFQIEQPCGIRTIRIGASSTEPTWELTNAGPPVRRYNFIDDDDLPLCPTPAPSIDPWQVLTGPQPRINPYAPSHAAVLVGGETYHLWDATVARSGSAGARWFTIACEGDALAKMRYLGGDPARRGTVPAHRQATLKMLTARYCGRQSWTQSGVAVQWTPSSQVVYDGRPDPATVDGIEALWTADGAVCLSHLRLVNTNKIELAQREAQLRAQCGIPTCDPATVPVAPQLWSTHTVNHPAHGSLP